MSSPRTTSAPTASSFSVALAGIAAGQPGSTGLGLANERGITIEMSDSQASWQDRPYQQEVTMTNPPS
jgi:hypothetical protein